MTLNERSEVKSNTSGFLDHDFLYDGNTYWVSTGNNKADMAIIFHYFGKWRIALGGPERPILVQFSRKLNPVGTMTYITLVFNMIGLGIYLWMK